ncbi:MAG TPA: hypothetical protein VLL07_02055 [Pontiella sp.]|nr:hypothetical protein [Pontiella sp.]
MKFHIVTPALNQRAFLRRCVASVRDQAREGVGHRVLGVGAESVEASCKQASLSGNPTSTSNFNLQTPNLSVHHHIQDGGSTDGTREFLEKFRFEVDGLKSEVAGQRAEGQQAYSQQPIADSYSFSFKSERDSGMYDALNRGIDSSLEFAVDGLQKEDHQENNSNFTPPTSNCHDSVVAWLNCDEQYLPGTLQTVADFFANHPDVDVLCGHALVVDESGELKGFWKSMPLRKRYVQSGYLYNLSCAMFFRTRVFEQGLRFNPEFKALGDQEFMIRLLGRGVKTAVHNRFFSAYTFMPGNLSEQEIAREESDKLLERFWGGACLLRFFWRSIQRAERVLRGCRYQRFPVEYAIYVKDACVRRVNTGSKVSARWPGERVKGRG